MEGRDAEQLAEILAATRQDRSNDTAKRRLEEIVHRLCVLISRDRPIALRRLQEEQQKVLDAARDGTTSKHVFLPSPRELLAKGLMDFWREIGEDVAGIEVWEGYCFVTRCQWFVVAGDPEEVMEPVWDYVIDPMPAGVLVFGVDRTSAAAGILCLAPLTPWQKGYTGMPEQRVRAQEAAAEAAQ